MVLVVLDFADQGLREQIQREESRGIVVTTLPMGFMKQASKQGMVVSRSSMYFAGKLTR